MRSREGEKKLIEQTDGRYQQILDSIESIIENTNLNEAESMDSIQIQLASFLANNPDLALDLQNVKEDMSEFTKRRLNQMFGLDL